MGAVGRGDAIPPLLLATLAGLAAASLAMLASLVLAPAPEGAAPVDFVLVWAAGAAARAGEAAAFYDPAVAKAGEVAAAGRDFAGVYRWVYPPILSLVAAPLSLLPLGLAHATFASATFAGFAGILARIGGPAGLLLAVAWPASLACALVGQNGFLVASLLGAGVLALDRRPLLAGCLFGLLAFKPHLAILVPLALAAAGSWRAVAAAAATVAILAAASIAAFGPAPWSAFLAALPATQDGLLGDGIMGFGKLQTAYGAARSAGLPAAAAGLAQAVSAAAGAALVWRVWRDPAAPASRRLAALACGTALATPYLYVYDLPLLAFAAAAPAWRRAAPADLAAIGGAILCLLAHPFTGAPTGLGASLLLAVVVARRGPG